MERVGPRLRQLRLEREATLADLAAETGISVSTLSRLESGGRRPTLELLLPLARAHGVALDELVDAPETGDPRVRSTPVVRHGRTYLALTRRPGGLQSYKIILPPSPSARPETSTHEGHEWLYVLSGTVRLVLGSRDLALEPGEVVEFDTRTPHWVGNPGPHPAEVLGDLRPAGRADARPLLTSPAGPCRHGGMDAHDAGRTARSLETLHALCYFSAEVDSALVEVGLRKGRMCYFAGRAAAMGRVGAGPVTATFYVFNPSLVAHFIPSAWDLASPDDVHAARYRGVDAAYRNLLGDDAIGSAEMEEAAGLARTLAEGCAPEGRALHAAHADLTWPEEPHLVLFHALTLVREHRGDGHVAALLHAGLSGREALVTHTATGKGFTVPAAQATRGWSAEEWQQSVDALAERGLMTGGGELTEDGVALRRQVEEETDRLGLAPWAALGDDSATRLRELARPFAKQAVANGAFPADVFA